MLRFCGISELPSSKSLLFQAKRAGLLGRDGLIYLQVDKWIRPFGCRAIILRRLSIQRLTKELIRGNPIIASLKKRDGSGHLVVFYEVDTEFWVMDPAQPTPYSLTKNEMKERFNKRGLSITLA